MKLELQATTIEDLHTLFKFQMDPEGVQMAAFTAEDPSDKEAYIKKWTGIVQNPSIFMQTIWMGGRITGSVVHFQMGDETDVSYWIDRELWGQGIATRGLQAFLKNTDQRPLYARTAFDNIGSQRVLEKCGFQRIGTEKGFANARGKEIEEFVYRLNA